MITSILALMIPLSAIIVWSPVGRALAGRIERGPRSSWDDPGAIRSAGAAASGELAPRVAMLETLVASLSTQLDKLAQERNQLESRLTLAERALEKQHALGGWETPTGARALGDGQGQ